MLKNILLVGLGGAIGAMLRYGVSLAMASFSFLGNMTSQVATFVVNALGSLVLGFLMSDMVREAVSSEQWFLLATVGICGGFTTFSTFSVQSMTFLQQGKYLPAALYIAGTVLVCLLFSFAGFYLGRR